jgi:two-component system, NarL family, nitrate/nitrite response regulator NarL
MSERYSLPNIAVYLFRDFDGLAPCFLLFGSKASHTQGMHTTVLVLEDDDFTRMALVETLTSHGIDVVADCKRAPEAVVANKALKPAAAILDLDLGRGPTGLDVARALRKANSSIGIVFLTSFSDPRMVTSSGQKPPAGSQYLVKKSVGSVKKILDALEKSLVSRKVGRWGPETSSDFGRLTDSQVQTLRLIAEGFSNQEIARRLSIAEKSVEQQVGRIAKRLGITRDLDLNVRVSIAKAYFRQVRA